MNNSSDVPPFYLGYEKITVAVFEELRPKLTQKENGQMIHEIYNKNIYNIGSEPTSKCVLIERLGS